MKVSTFVHGLAVALLAMSLLPLFAEADTCITTSALNFTSQQGSLWLNGNAIKLKGASWFGFETDINVVHGLWAQPYTFFLDFLSNNSFNIIRMPYNLAMVLNDPTVSSSELGANSNLVGLSALQIMDTVIEAAASRGILIMLDLHSFTGGSYASDGLWYNSNYPETTVTNGWIQLLNRYKDQWNVVAADLKNEPFSTTWATGTNSTDWNTAAARIANAIASSVSSRFLIFVEGTASSPSASEGCFYGEDLIGVDTTPVVLDYQYKLVYSPHVYGPSVYGQPYFSAANFPDNMPAIWDSHWGFIPARTGNAVVLGEWGGPMNGTTQTWLEAMASYLKSNNMTDQFVWCLNPDSSDTGGLLADDWTTPVSAKLTLLANLVPSPTKFSPNGSQVCITTSSSGGGSGGSSPSPSPGPASGGGVSSGSSLAVPQLWSHLGHMYQ